MKAGTMGLGIGLNEQQQQLIRHISQWAEKFFFNGGTQDELYIVTVRSFQ